MMASSEIVNVRIESHSKSGVERLDDVIRQMGAMVKLLSEFVNDPSISEVEVLGLEKHSPLTAQLRIVTVRKAPPVKRGRSPRKPIVTASVMPVRRLERIYEVATGEKRTRAFHAQGLLALSDCAKQLRSDVATIETADKLMVIDRAMIEQINDKLGSVKHSVGSIAGMLEGVNVHSTPWSFTLYPEIGPRKVRCIFDEAVLPDVQRLLKQRVVVHGIKEYVLDSPLPSRVKVQRIEGSRETSPGAWLTLIEDLSEAWNSASDEDQRSVVEGWAA